MPKWTLSHTFIVIVGCVMAVLASLAKDPVTAPWAAPVLGVLTALLGYLGLNSGKAWGKPPGSAVVVLAIGLSFGEVTCLPASFPNDILQEYECVQKQVEAGNTNVGSIVIACKLPEEQIVVDAINSLLNSPKWVGEHPHLVRGLVQMGARAR